MSRRRQYRPQPTTDARPPEQRLEALVRERNPERATRTLGRIRSDLDANPDPGPWIAAARTLSERLVISENTLYYFVELFTECVVFSASRADPELVRIEGAMAEIERAHGLRDGDYWDAEQAPDDWRTLDEAWASRAGVLVATCLRELGHADIAELRDANRGAFERRAEQGRIDLWGEDEPDDY